MGSEARRRPIWGALWRSDNKMDGYREWLLNGPNCLPVMFRTRREARAYIDETLGYIRERPDLRAQPHGWKIPIPVRVKVDKT